MSSKQTPLAPAARPCARRLFVNVAAFVLATASVLPATARDPHAGGVAMTAEDAAKLRWLFENYGVDPALLLATLDASRAAPPSPPIQAFIVHEAYAIVAADPAYGDGHSGLPSLAAIDAWDGIGRCGLGDAGAFQIPAPAPEPLGVSADAELDHAGGWNPPCDAGAHDWNPWLGDGRAPAQAGVNYARLVRLVATQRGEARRAHFASYLAHTVADAVRPTYGDAVTLDLATLETLDGIAARWVAAPHTSLDEWLASPILDEAVKAVERRVATLAPAAAAAYWQRIDTHIGKVGGTTLLRRTAPGTLAFLAIPASTRRTALAAYLTELAARPKGKPLDAFYASFDPFSYNGPLVEAVGEAPTLRLGVALSERARVAARLGPGGASAGGAAAGGHPGPVAATSVGAGRPESSYLPWQPAPGFGAFDETRNEQALRATLAGIARRCAKESHGEIGAPTDFGRAFEAPLTLAIRCVATAYRGSITALRVVANGRKTAGDTTLRIQLDITNRAPSSATLRQARMALRSAAGRLETRPGWIVELGNRPVAGPHPVSIGVTVEGVPADTKITDFIVDVQADFGALPDSGRARAAVGAAMAQPADDPAAYLTPPAAAPTSGRASTVHWIVALVLALVVAALAIVGLRARARGAPVLRIGIGLGLATGLAVLFTVLALTGGGAPGDAPTSLADSDAPRLRAEVEVVAPATGPLAPIVMPVWSPAELATPTFDLDGPVPRELPGAGIASLDALRQALASPLASPPAKALPDFAALAKRWREALITTDGDVPDLIRAAFFDPLLRFVPPSAWFVLGVDLQALRQAPAALRALVPRVVHAADGTGWLGTLGVTEAAMDPAGPPAAVVAATPEAATDPNEALFLVGGASYARGAIESRLRAAKPEATVTTGGVVPVWALGAAALALDTEGWLLAGVRGFRAALLARAGDCILWTGGLAPPLRATRLMPVARGLGAFLVATPPPAVQQALGTFLPELATLRQARVAIGMNQGLIVDAWLELPDPGPLAERLASLRSDAALLTAGASMRWLTITTAASGTDATLSPTALHLVLNVPETGLAVAAMLIAMFDF